MAETDDLILGTFGGQRQAAQSDAIGSLDDDPQTAARAVELGQAWGVSPRVVYGDLTSFERNQKAALTSQIISSNQHIADYLGSNAMAAKVSNDDYGQLDSTSAALEKLSEMSVLKAAARGFSEGFDYQGLKSDYEKLYNFVDHPAWRAFVGYSGFGNVAYAAGASTHVMTGALYGLGDAAGQVAKNLTGSDAWGKRLTRDAIQLAQVALPELAGGKITPELDLVARDAADSAKRVGPYIKAGEAPPVGLDPITDQAHIEQAKLDADNLKEAMKEAQKSATRERAPEMFADFVRQHNQDTIGISADAIRDLYGDKVPAPDDGVLGWVPRIQEQLQAAEATGGDVQVPLADYLAKVEPEVHKELEESIRFRDGGLTKLEATVGIEAYHGSPHEFEAFDIGKAGTGEGAQSYGFGHYFAENPKVSETYKKDNATVNGQPYNVNDPNHRAAGLVHDLGYEKALNAAREQRSLDAEGFNQQIYDIIASGKAPKLELKGGNLYKARILRRPEEFLDWDRPLSQQDPAIKESLAKVPEFSVYLNSDQLTPADVLKLPGRDEKALSKALGEAGIAGIKYLDQFSRGEINVHEMHESMHDRYGKFSVSRSDKTSGESRILSGAGFDTAEQAEAFAAAERAKATSNYVVFRDSDIEVLERNGEAVRTLREANRLQPLGVPEAKPTDAFKQIADAQRGAPESAMLRIQKIMGGGVLNPVVEHAGDLVHRMTEYVQETNAGYEFVKEKVDRVLRYLQHPYGFEKEFNENIAANARSREEPPEKLKAEVAAALRTFSDEHAKLPALNEAHRVANQINIDIGKQNWRGAEAGLEKLKEHLGSREEWTKYASVDETSKAPEPQGKPTTKAEQLELPETTRMEDRKAFEKAAAIGMTKVQYDRYQKLIAQRIAEDREWMEAKALAAQRKEQTAEWKANRAELRPEVEKEISASPEHELDRMLREGKVTIAAGPEFLELLPQKYLSSKGGVDIADLAAILGAPSGRDLADRYMGLVEQRERSGMKPGDFLKRTIDAETDRRMIEKYGELDRNIIDDARDQVLSATQEDMLYEQMLALAEKSGLQYSLSKDEVAAAVKRHFDGLSLREIKTDRFLADAGRAGRATELALLKGDPAEAFRQAQRQFLAISFARQAKGIEKATKAFEKTAKRFSAREVAAVDQDYTNWIHQILTRVGRTVKRSVQDLEESLARGGDTGAKTLEDFVDHKQIFGLREVPVAEFLFDNNWRKPFEELTAQEFRAVHDSIKALVKNGAEEKKIYKAGEAADLAEVKKDMIRELEEFKEKHYDAKGGRWMVSAVEPGTAKKIRGFGFAHLQIESIFNRWDRGNPFGIWTQYVMRDLVDSANREAALEREFAKKYRELRDTPLDAKMEVPNQLLMEPYSVRRGNPIALKLNHENLRALILNVGNQSNLTKLARGYNVDETALMNWLFSVSKKEDWDWAQRYGDIFAEFKATHSDPMYRRVSGIEPEAVPIEPLRTPFGDYKGWYYPIIYHPLYEGASRRLMGGDALEGDHYYRATTPNGYIEKRTGYVGHLDLSLDRGVSRLRQMIHDVAFREAIINASKIFYDTDVRAAIAHHYGAEARDMLVPYLKDVANASSIKNEVTVLDASLGEAIRQNMISVLVGLNPGTVAKHAATALYQSIHEVGGKEFLNAFASMWLKDDYLAESNWRFAMQTSEELQRRVRNYQEVLRGGSENLFKEFSWRDVMIHLGSYPVSMSDLISAVPTWLAQYKKTLAETGEKGDAVFAADRAVRRAHGSTAITNRPEIMRRGNLWFASLYGFFNHIMNRQYEIAWKAADAIEGKETQLVRQPDGSYIPEKAKIGKAAIPGLTAAVMAYVIVPALVEEIVSPLPADKHEGWTKWAAKSLVKDLSSSWVYARDIAHAILTGRDPTAGLVSTSYQTLTNMARDLGKDRPFSKEHFGNVLQHSISLFGAATGLANQQMGRDAKFMWNYSMGIEKPRGWGDWYRGLRYGTIKQRGH